MIEEGVRASELERLPGNLTLATINLWSVLGNGSLPGPRTNPKLRLHCSYLPKFGATLFGPARLPCGAQRGGARG